MFWSRWSLLQTDCCIPDYCCCWHITAAVAGKLEYAVVELGSDKPADCSDNPERSSISKARCTKELQFASVAKTEECSQCCTATCPSKVCNPGLCKLAEAPNHTLILKESCKLAIEQEL